jgi:hypothetical protein
MTRLLEAQTLRDAVAAGGVAAIVSGAPSTVDAVLTGGRVLDGALAAGSIVLPREKRPIRLLLAAGPVHLALSLGWALVLAAALPSRRPIAAGALAGLGIAALDLGIIGRHFDRIRALPLGPQIADHLAYGIAVGAVLRVRRSGQAS